ncbi:porphobilinogen synthase [Hahella sp. HN01]|uniref:porphobilinogen synthase n=1 Tax=Hahella sp. HN01 TaxID=2847262 RepID=UPI001C1F19C2|nr:porphobilinogen synthase [Hahella sp. HN01]MBU6954096.1 porphobilinogen synthase [Hahella sp. HN01]
MAQASFPVARPRRLRRNNSIRDLVRETALRVEDLVYPLFVIPGVQQREAVASMPGVERLSPDLAVELCVGAWRSGIKAVLLFGLPEVKDSQGRSAWEDGPVQQALRLIRQAAPGLTLITDVCLCQYAEHGHCGVLCGDGVDNDRTLALLAKVALSHARAGADVVAPAAMMDGQVAAIRRALDADGFQNVSVMSYAVKYASAFYGPFRDAADSAPAGGDRKHYQMDPANLREAMREAELDAAEGADFLMVKPAMVYLDVLRKLRDRFDLPMAAYNVSGEYAMVKAAAANGWIDERSVVLETLLSMKRAGADMIISYHALDAARWLQET